MTRKQIPKWLAIVALLALLLLALVPSAAAFDGRSGEVIVIAADETVQDDLMVTADRFTLDGVVSQDLIVFANDIIINGTVQGDFMAVAQEITINGELQDDVRIAGMSIYLGEGAVVNDDLMVAAYGLESIAGSQVQGNLFYAGNVALLAGEVDEDLAVAAGGVELAGRVGGDVKLDVGASGDTNFIVPVRLNPDLPRTPDVAPGLTVRPSAAIIGDLNYRSPEEVNIPRAAVGGSIDWRKATTVEVTPAARVEETASSWLLDHLRQLTALIIVGLLMVWLLPRWTRRVANEVEAHPLPSLGWGLVTFALVITAFFVIFFVMIALAIFLGLLTLGNLAGAVIVLGLLALFALAVAFALTVAYVSKITVSYLGGRLLLARVRPEWAESRIWPLLLGLILLVILTAIPVLGGLIEFVVVLLGLGALWLLGWHALQSRKAPAISPDLPKSQIAFGGGANS